MSYPPTQFAFLFPVCSLLILGSACATGGAVPGDASENTDGQILQRADADPSAVFDARPAPILPDAGPLPADASPDCVAEATNILTNGGFDDVTPSWVEESGGGFAIITNDADITNVSAQSGSFVAWLGGYSAALISDKDVLYQDLHVPADATPITLKGKLFVSSAETLGLAFDLFKVEIVNIDNGMVLETLANWSNLNSKSVWEDFSLPLVGAYAGQNIRLRWTTTFDANKSTSFLIDNLSLDTTSCP